MLSIILKIGVGVYMVSNYCFSSTVTVICIVRSGINV